MIANTRTHEPTHLSSSMRSLEMDARTHTRAPAWLRMGEWIACWLRPFRSRRPAMLVIRPGSLGDALLFTGALRVLRAQYPDHQIVLVASNRGKPVFERSPYWDRLLLIDDHLGHASLSARARRTWFACRVFMREYEKVVNGVTWSRIHAETDSLSGWLPGLMDAVVAAESISLSQCITQGRDTSELDVLLQLLQKTGCPRAQTRKDIWPEHRLTESDRQWASQRLTTRRAEQGRGPILALCPGARFKQKDWGADNYARLLTLLAQDPRFKDAHYVFLGGPEDRECIASIRSELPDGMAVTDLAGATTISQTLAIIEQCDLCLGNDTFGLHAAITVGTPSVVLMWGGDGGRWAPWGDPEKHRMVRAAVDCAGCDGECIHRTPECMQKIRPEDIIDRLRQALNE